MKKYLLSLILVLYAAQATAQWQRAPWAGFDPNLEYMRKINCIKQFEGRLFACAENGLFISPDFGTTWNRVGSIPLGFKAQNLHNTTSGLYLMGNNSGSGGAQFAAFVNYDKQGLAWELIDIPIVSCSAFVRHGSNNFAISHNYSNTPIYYSNNLGQNWNLYQPVNSSQGVVDRFTWHRDTLYMNFTMDNRIYRSLDHGNTVQLFTSFPVSGFQKIDGVLAGQLMLSSGAASDTLVYTLNEGQTWIKKKLNFLTGSKLLHVHKIDGRIYLKARNPNNLGIFHAFDFNTQTITDTFGMASLPYLDDHNFEFGAISGDCYIGALNDTIYRACNGVRTNLSFPGNGISMRELYSWRDSLFLLEGSQLLRAYSSTNLDASPTYHAVSEAYSIYGPLGYAHYRDTIYSVHQPAYNYIAKTNTVTQIPELEKVINDGFQLDAVMRTSTHLLAKYGGTIYYRPLSGGNWQSFEAVYLQLAANANYAYSFQYYPPSGRFEFFRLLPTGEQDLLHIDGFDYSISPFFERTVLAAHDSVVFVMIIDNYMPRTLFYSTNNGLSFTSVDARTIADAPARLHYLDGKIFVLCNFKGIYEYDALSDSWSPYNDGFPQRPTSFAALNHELVAGTSDAGLFRRPIQPTYRAQGRVFLDKNNNAQWDADEPPVAKIGVKSTLAGAEVFTTGNGAYISASDLPLDSHRVILPHPLLKTIPTSVVTDNANISADFALQTPNEPDLTAALYTPNVFRPGFDTKIFANLRNLLGSATGVQLTLVLPVSKVNFVNATPAPIYQSTTGDTLIWELGNLDIFSDTTLILNLKTAVTTPLGNAVNLDVWVSSNETDAEPLNNRASLLATVVGSYDPNDKLVDRAALRIQSPPIKERLTYTIRFQNTGTFPTAFVTLYDTLDTQVFDPATIIWLGSSHPYEARLIDNRVLKIRFDPLALVPQSESEANSQGFVSFSISTRQPLGTPKNLTNRAGIYFDFNAPIITPMAQTVVDFTIPTKEAVAAGVLSILPNPSSGMITLYDDDTTQEQLQVSIYNDMGQLLLQRVLLPGERSLRLESLPKGLLCIRVISRSGTKLTWVVYE